jgi:hypothetical protein
MRERSRNLGIVHQVRQARKIRNERNANETPASKWDGLKKRDLRKMEMDPRKGRSLALSTWIACGFLHIKSGMRNAQFEASKGNDYLPIIAQVAAQPTVLLLRMEEHNSLRRTFKAEGFQQGSDHENSTLGRHWKSGP